MSGMPVTPPQPAPQPDEAAAAVGPGVQDTPPPDEAAAAVGPGVQDTPQPDEEPEARSVQAMTYIEISCTTFVHTYIP